MTARPLTQSSVLNPQFFLDVLFLAALVAYVLAGTPLVPFHGDESTQIYMSRDYADQFQRRDLDLVRYQADPPGPQRQFLRLINGSVNKYLIGLAWHLGGFSVGQVNEQWDWNGGWQYNLDFNHAPSPELLLTARWPSALLLAASVVILFLLAQRLGGRPVAYLACLYFALNPAALINGRRAMMEGSLYCFTLLTVLAGVLFLRRPGLPTGLLLGAATGLAVASKHPALFTVAPVYAACVGCLTAAAARRLNVSIRGLIVGLVLAAVLALLIFYALNPVWWGAPLFDQVGALLKERTDLLNSQSAAFGGYLSRLDQLAGFLHQTFIVQPQYFEAPGWSEHLAGQIAAYAASPWRGLALGGSLIGAVVMAALALIGGAAFIRDHDLPASTRWLVGLWALVTVLTAWLLTPIEWQRYYLPVFPVVGLFAAFGLAAIIHALTPHPSPSRRGAKAPSQVNG